MSRSLDYVILETFESPRMTTRLDNFGNLQPDFLQFVLFVHGGYSRESTCCIRRRRYSVNYRAVQPWSGDTLGRMIVGERCDIRGTRISQ